MKLEQLYLDSPIVLFGRQPKIIRLNDECHIQDMSYEQGDTCVSIIDNGGKLHLIPLVNVLQMTPAVIEKKAGK